MRTRISGAGAALVVVLAVVAVPAARAAPVTVNLRIEGPTSTLFEGLVTTDVRTFAFNGGSDTTQHQCDGTAATGGPSAVPVPTRGAAVAKAAADGLPIEGSFGSFGASFTKIAGVDVSYNPSTNEFLGEYENFAFASLGACSDDAANGDEDLFAYGTGSEQLLKLAGPATVAPSTTATVTVTDGGTAAPVSGAAVGGATTVADGTATVGPFTTRGPQTLKATKTGAIRSNRVVVCVTDGADGFCGTTKPGDPAPPPPTGPPPYAPVQGSLAVSNGSSFALTKAPRELGGSLQPGSNGLSRVRIRLRRRVGSTCSFFSVKNERFYRRPCNERGFFYTLPVNGTTWSYLLPLKLLAGSYRLESFGVDGTNNPGPTVTSSFTVKAAPKKGTT
jgi:hypothetical protein